LSNNIFVFGGDEDELRVCGSAAKFGPHDIFPFCIHAILAMTPTGSPFGSSIAKLRG
jgi:hypothetical protein